MCGGRFSMARRSCISVSPVRTAVRISGISNPRSPAICRISLSGTSRFFWMSLPSAFSGDTYRTSVRSSRSPASALRTRRSMQARNAASVLPEPVGAEISVVRPARICGQPCSCGSVGVPNFWTNHSATRGCAQAREEGRDMADILTRDFRKTFAHTTGHVGPDALVRAGERRSPGGCASVLTQDPPELRSAGQVRTPALRRLGS